MMVALVIQKGSTRPEYISNLESTIKNPVDLDKVNQIISLLETNNLQNTKTYNYIKLHQNNLRVWGAKTHNYGNIGFDDVKRALGEMMGFVAGDLLKYVGTISGINDIDNKDITSKISSILWEDPNWLNIWFLDNVRSMDNLSRNWMISILDVNIFSEVFTNNMQDNLRIIDSSKAAENRIELLLKAILENSTPVKIERERTIAEAAKLALEELGKESELETIYNMILEKSLYRFGAVEPLTALRIQMDRFSNNVQREDSSKESYFYRENGKYGLLSWRESKEIIKDPVLLLLEKKKQIILYGPPGTGKTYQARNFAVNFIDGNYKIYTNQVVRAQPIDKDLYLGMYTNLTSYVKSLGSDIEEKEQETREATFNSISKISKKPKRLVYFNIRKDKSIKVWVRNPTNEIIYPNLIKAMPDYRDKELDPQYKDWYPSFVVTNQDDLDKAKELIKFAYDNL